MLFVHLADTHLGYRQFNLEEREEDFYSVFREAIDKIIKERPSFVIHSGDLFEERRPSVRALIEVKNAIKRLKDAGIRFYTIGGNHDLPRRLGDLAPHLIYDDMFLLNGNFFIDGEIFIGGIPYHSKLSREELLSRMKFLSKKAEGFKKKILIMHQGIDKFVPEFELELKNLDGFDYYALGHLHTRILSFGSGTLAYPGSLEIWRIDEYEGWRSDGKGFYLVDFSSDEPKVHKIDVTPRNFLKERIDASCDLERIKENAKDAVVYVEIEGTHQEYKNLSRRINEVLGKIALKVNTKFCGEEIESFEASAIDLKEIFKETMEGNDIEIDFAYELYRFLSSKNLDGALELAKKFFEKCY